MRRLYFNSIGKPLQPCMQYFLFLPKAFIGRVFSWKTGTRSGRESVCSLPGLPRNQVCQETRETRCKFVAKFCFVLCLFGWLVGWLVGLALGWERQSTSMSKVESYGALAASLKRNEKEKPSFFYRTKPRRKLRLLLISSDSKRLKDFTWRWTEGIIILLLLLFFMFCLNAEHNLY